MIQVRVWDLPTRFFHWALALLCVALVVTGEMGGNAMIWHFRAGYAVGTLLIFRILWGFMGGYWSRWQQLSVSLQAVQNYLRKGPAHYWGHNPIGSLSVLAMLSLLIVQVGTGLFSDDDIANAGPLTRLVSERVVSLATQWHSHFGKVLIIILVLTHVLAIAWYFFKHKENLVKPMLTGDKFSSTHEDIPSSHDRPLDWLRAILFILVSAALVYALISFGE